MKSGFFVDELKFEYVKIFKKIFEIKDDAQIISQVIESKDSDIKAIGNALIEVAPQWAQVRKGVQEGILVEGVNIEANLVEAVHLIRKARQQNLSLSERFN